MYNYQSDRERRRMEHQRLYREERKQKAAAMRDALRKYAVTNPKDFAELQARARVEAQQEIVARETHKVLRAKAELLQREEMKRAEIEASRFREMRGHALQRHAVALVVDGREPCFDNVIGKVVYRHWKVGVNGALRSVAMSGLHWRRSECISDIVPTTYNNSGFYGVELTPTALVQQNTYIRSALGNSNSCVYGDLEIGGLVEFRGKVFTHSDGMVRGEWARIVHLYFTCSTPDLYTVVPKVMDIFPDVPVDVVSPDFVLKLLFRLASEGRFRDGW